MRPSQTVNRFSQEGSWYLRSFIIAFLALTIAACDTPTPEEPTRFGSSRWPGFEPFYAAEVAGLYKPNSVHLIENPASMAMIKALRSSTLDASAMSLSRVMAFVQSDLDLTIVAMIDRSNGADTLVARPEIRSVADLRGRKVGTEIGTVNGYLLMRALQVNNIPFNEVTILDIANEDLANAYASGEVDAIAAFAESEATVLELGGHVIFSSRDIEDEIIDVLSVRTAYLRQHPEKISELIYGWMRGIALVEAAKSRGNYGLRTGLVEESDFWKSLNGLSLATPEDNVSFLASDGAKLKDLMTQRRAISAQLGILDPDTPLPKVDSKPFQAAYERWQSEQQVTP